MATMLGGAMYAWQRGFTKNGKVPWYARVGAVAFALFAAIAAIGTGSAVQASAMTGIMTSSGLQVEPWIIGIVIVMLVAAVIFGGVKIISDVWRAPGAGHGDRLRSWLRDHPGVELGVFVGCARAHLRMRVHGEGCLRWRSGLGHHGGAPVRVRARALLERVGSWFSTDHRGGSEDEESC